MWEECWIPCRRWQLNEGKRHTPAAGTPSSNTAVALHIKRGQCWLWCTAFSVRFCTLLIQLKSWNCTQSTEVDWIISTIVPSSRESFSASRVCTVRLASLIERLFCQAQSLYLWLHLITSNMGVVTKEGSKTTVMPSSLHLSHSVSMWVWMCACSSFVLPAPCLLTCLLLDCSEPLSSCDVPQISVCYRV